VLEDSAEDTEEEEDGIPVVITEEFLSDTAKKDTLVTKELGILSELL